jgi:CxxC motif-containing protein (DUF1111 family)
MQRTVRKTTYVWLAATGVCCLLVTLWRPDAPRLMAADRENLTVPLAEELKDLFNAGLEEFEEKETTEEGLGPVFNGTSCAECHAVPSVGGSEPNVGIARETRIGRRFNRGFDPLDGSIRGSVNRGGGLLQQRVIDLPACNQLTGEVVPPEATIVSLRNTTALFGLGLVAAIPADTITSRKNGGKFNMVLNPDTNKMELGRFGWKAQVATLHQFAGDAYLNEMGITNPSFRQENKPQGQEIPKDCDTVADPKDNGEGVTGFTNFMKFLAPAEPRRAATDEEKGLFMTTGCASCHIPTMTTGPNAIDVPVNQPVNLYSDLLLHDIGTDDGIVQGLAQGNEFRTAPLWGLSRRDRFMHDAKSNKIEDAILRHGGQAQPARDAFVALEPAKRDVLLAFLNSL